jgi:hypothetical protein
MAFPPFLLYRSAGNAGEFRKAYFPGVLVIARVGLPTQRNCATTFGVPALRAGELKLWPPSIVNRLEAEGRSGRQGRLVDYLTRLDFIILDELGYLRSPRSAASCCST